MASTTGRSWILQPRANGTLWMADIVPVLTLPSVANVTTNSADGRVTVSRSGGTLYGVLTTSATAPSAAQVKGGQDETGSAAVKAASALVTSLGQKTFSFSSLSGTATLYAHFVHNASGVDSAVVSSIGFTLLSSAIAFALPDLSNYFLQGSPASLSLHQYYQSVIPAGHSVADIYVSSGALVSGLSIDVANEEIDYDGVGAVASSPIVLDVVTAPVTLDRLQDFINRRSDSSVVWWHGFENAAEVNQFRWTGGYNGGNDPSGLGTDANFCSWVSSGGVDGGGFLRLTYPAGRSSNSCYWYRPFNAFTGATNGKGTNDPGANGSITPIAWPASNGSNTTLRWTTDASNPAMYGHATDQAANPTKYQGNDYYFQVRVRRASLPGPPPDNANFSNIVGKSVWPNITTSTSTAQEIVTYGEAYSESSLSQQPRHRMYEGRNRSGGPGIGGTSETDTINNADGIGDWRYSGGWDTLLYHVTPGTQGGTGTNRTRIEVWAQHDLTLFPAEAGQYAKIWDVLYSAAFDTGGNTSGGVSYNGWNALILAIYHNGAVFSTSFNFDYDQVIFSKATIAAPQV